MAEFTLNRRQVCRILAAGPAAVALAGQAPAAEKPFRLRYCLASCMYGTLKLEDILPEVRKIGADSIDLWPPRHGDQRDQIDALGHDRFAAMLRDNDVKLGAITRFDLGPFKLRDEIGVLRKLGGTVLVTGSRSGKPPEGEELKQAVRQFVEEMKPHASAAAEQGATIAIENHGNALLCSPDSLRWFGEMARWDGLGVALAPYHLPQDPRLLAGLIEDLGPKLTLFYAWQHGDGCMEKLPKERELLQMPGRGPLDFAPMLAALKKIDFQGYTEIFMHPVPRGIPILDTLGEVTAEINRARAYLERLLD
ncbi:MAG: TIM barrel protein [Rhodopirellula sp.]|nr:TIM barrel protein [Rhodopirellula sp.]